MIATKSESFSRDVTGDRQKLLLVGMSNMGKSHWSKLLAEDAGWNQVDVDARIGEKLETVMNEDGVEGSDITAVAEWMGSPHASDPAVRERFPERQQRYLDLETGEYEAVSQNELARRSYGNTVIDTTGSFVHVAESLQSRLARKGVVVYLEATEADYEEMLQAYMKIPKPVVWGANYSEEAGEAPEESIERSYRTLLMTRAKGYAAVADVAIPRMQARELSGAGEFLRTVESKLAS